MPPREDILLNRSGSIWCTGNWKHKGELEAESDLFSPGYFKISLKGGQKVAVDARVNDPETHQRTVPEPGDPFIGEQSLEEAFNHSLDAFLVNRGQNLSVIAGYPWFLDWGRDSLIFCRCLIQLGRFTDARAVLGLFGRFEENGTLPNMICGDDAAKPGNL